MERSTRTYTYILYNREKYKLVYLKFRFDLKVKIYNLKLHVNTRD